MTRNRKREAYLMATGRGLTVRGDEMERALHRVRSAHARGMTFQQMERQTGVAWETFRGMTEPGRSFIRRSTLVSVSRLCFEAPDDHAWVDPTGLRRRLGALWLDGFTLPWLAEHLPFGNRNYFQAVLRGGKCVSGVQYANTVATAALYDKLDGVRPQDVGIGLRAQRFSAAFAAKRGCAARYCWDFDTIDDPTALPEWTGVCGTPFGRLVHQREGIPVCERCAKAPGVRFSPDRLKGLRIAQGLTHRALEDLTGCSNGVVHHWEAGRYKPSPAVLDRLLSALDATYEDVYEEEM